MDLARAASLAQSGRFAEAAQLYREALARAPEHAEATHFLGVCLVRSERRDEGLALLERSLELAPRNAMYRVNAGLMLAEAGRFGDAERAFSDALAIDPASSAAHNYLGMVRQRLGRHDEAVASYHEALRLRPGDAGAANNLGYCLLERGELEAALVWLRRAIAADPANAMAHCNLGNALRAAGNLQEAVSCYRRALALAPQFANAHYNLALALRELGDGAGALQAVRAALRNAPGDASTWQLFAELLAPCRFEAWDAALAADCERLFSQTEVEVQACAEAVLSLVRTAQRGRLFVLLLEHAIVADEAFEREMIALRRELLGAPVSMELVCALAQQCFLNEYVWPEDGAETAVLAGLEQRAATPLELAVLAMYRPLRGRERPPGGGEAFARLWRRLVEEPGEEAAIDVPVLTPVEDTVSRAVQAQYEANPYPRWHRAPVTAPYPLPHLVRSLFPDAKVPAPLAPEVLIAGCGTGRHAAIAAQMYPHGQILALDISRASLAYAMRRSRELGLANVRFAQADLLELGTLEQRFDLVECSGVLHHLRDPLAGWRALLALLKPGGLMKVGLYSELARRHIVAARRRVEGLDVRAARERIFALPADDAAREVTRLRDFYCASGVRDLVLHVQEHRFTIETLSRALDALNVEFLGFEFAGERRAMPLADWAAYEAAHPDTFASMYQFWIRKPEGGAP